MDWNCWRQRCGRCCSCMSHRQFCDRLNDCSLPLDDTGRSAFDIRQDYVLGDPAARFDRPTNGCPDKFGNDFCCLQIWNLNESDPILKTGSFMKGFCGGVAGGHGFHFGHRSFQFGQDLGNGRCFPGGAWQRVRGLDPPRRDKLRMNPIFQS